MKAETKILFIWKVKPELKKYLQTNLSVYPQIKLIFPQFIDNQKLKKSASGVDVIVGWRPTEEMLKNSEFSLFINPGAGVQHLIKMFRKIRRNKEITLINGHGNAYFTAQHALALLLNLTNRIIDHHSWMKQGFWRTGDREGASLPLRDRKIGLLGYGKVNSKVHQMLLAFEPKIYILRKHKNLLPHHPFKELFDPRELNTFLTKIDTLFIALPLTEKTENLIGESEIKLLGKESLLVNISRGKVVNEAALYNSLKKGTIMAAAIDVWYNYKPLPDQNGKLYPFEFPFQELDNVILSPHRAASPFSDLKRWDDVIENIKRFHCSEKKLINVVDLDQGY